MNDRELLPCPHCGKTPRRQGDEYSERVVCQCGACTEWNDRYEVCIKLWNTRVTDPLIDEIAKQVATNYEKDMLLEKMADALEDLTERANRGREWLRTGPSGSGGNWGIFDTTIAEQALQEYREMKDAK